MVRASKMSPLVRDEKVSDIGVMSFWSPLFVSHWIRRLGASKKADRRNKFRVIAHPSRPENGRLAELIFLRLGASAIGGDHVNGLRAFEHRGQVCLVDNQNAKAVRVHSVDRSLPIRMETRAGTEC